MAKSAEQKRLEELLAKQEKTIAAAFRRYIDTVKSRPVLRDILKALEAGDVNAALRILDTHIATLASSLNQVFISTATAEIEAARQLFSKISPTVSISFDPGDLEASRIMRESRLSFIRDFTESQRQATTEAISDGLRAGRNPRAVARDFRDSIGLTDQQVQWVKNYRSNLENLEARALSRDLRDRRYDKTVQAAIRDGRSLTKEQIDKMVDRYQQRALAYRSEVIARTEALSTVSEAREEAMRQAFEEVDMPAERQVRKWQTAQDSRVRDTHRLMNGQKRGGNTPFNSPSGATLRYPGDRMAPKSEVIQCRCNVLYEILGPDETFTQEPDNFTDTQRPKKEAAFTEKSKPVDTVPPKPGKRGQEVEVPASGQADISEPPKPIKFSRQEVGEIEYYKGDGFYEMNKRLLDPDKYSPEQVAIARAQADRIDRIIDKSVTSRDHEVFRGIRSKELFDNAESMIGKRIEMVTPQSTSFDQGIARNYAGLFGDLSSSPGQSVLFKINVKKGSKALNVSSLTKINSAEKEILLKSSGTYTIKSVRNAGQYKIIEVDYES